MTWTRPSVVVRPRGALVRPPGDSFVRAISEHPDRDSIDPERARAQHARYREILEGAGLKVTVLPPDEDCPDSCFVQDLAVVLGDRALLCRPGVEARRGEARRMEPTLKSLMASVEAVPAPATVEGGDVLRLGNRFVVGLSDRTNETGMQAVERFAGPDARVATMAVPQPYLHLQTAVGALSDDLVVGPEPLLDEGALAGLEKVTVPEEEAVGCNMIAIGRSVVMAAGFPATRATVEDRGFDVQEVDLSEFLKADGGSTCLSVLY